MKIYIETLGCKVNQFESQAIASLLSERGHTVAVDSPGCDAFIVNTCAVTAESGRKSRQTIRRLRKENPDALGIVMGCYSQIEPEAVRALDVELITGTARRSRIVEAVETLRRGQEPLLEIERSRDQKAIEPLPAGKVPGRTRALMRIQDGCNNYCSYCVIPYARGPVRSMPLADIEEEARRLGEEGFRELVVTGIEVASYGHDLEGRPGLMDALERIAAAAPLARLRLGSLEPGVVTEDFAQRAAALPSLCPHFHLSLQSGCDKTLKAMRRHYTTEEFFAVTERLRRNLPGCALTTDLITGFPGETEEDFLKTLAFLRRVDFAAMHVFPFSPRPGTPAAVMDGQVEKSVKQERAARAIALGKETQRAYLDSQIGRTLSVLFESREGDAGLGHSENYCEVRALGPSRRGETAKVQITGREGTVLLGKILL